MGTYFNPGNKKFHDCVNDDIYVDKTGLIAYTSGRISKSGKYMCVTRPRRFGKSYTISMLEAYYSRGCKSRKLFAKLNIAKDPSFKKHLNKYNVVYVDVSGFMKGFHSDVTIPFILDKLQEEIVSEMQAECHGVISDRAPTFADCIQSVYNVKKIPFVFIIDEWDAIFRNRKDDVEGQTAFLNWLESALKEKEYVALVYMTGILPIKKYATGSALNMFREYTIIDPGPVNKYIGFTAEEVKKLAEGSGVSFEDLKYWYDGYNLDGIDIYNSNSVYWALTDKKLQGYWRTTESFEDLLGYVKEDRFGIHRVILDLLSEIRCDVDFSGYMNDLVTINDLNDIIAILVHLGYLAFDKKPSEKKEGEEEEKKKALPGDLMTDEDVVKEKVKSDGTVRIPNHEIYEEFLTVIKKLGSFEAHEFERLSEEIVSLTIKGTSDEDMEMLAERIERVHDECVSDVHNYNTENSLSNTVRFAYFAVINDFYSRTEAGSCRGRADVVFTPRKGRMYLPMVMEFKMNDTAENALKQIKDKKYYKAFYEYKGDVILLGIVYDSKTKKHVVKKEVITVDNTKLL